MIFNWLQYFSLENLKREFAEADLGVLSSQGDVSGSQYDVATGEFAVVAGGA